MTVTAELAAFASTTPASSVPDPVKNRAVALMTDFAASAIRAAGVASPVP